MLSITRLLALRVRLYRVPDVAAACAPGRGAKSSSSQHLHVFSPASLVLLGEHSDFALLAVERLVEPSSQVHPQGFRILHPSR